ncbi:aldose 1-epimerase family protein [Chitinophaga sp. MM2321]|uniref:aldose 1-epimerase family protein n=1 Tax=Chitinophaga sp. MM2321 TaxID=3137178 RepID=UPI0032D569F9
MDWKNKISHHAQLGGIETAVMDNGAGRGTRIAWINTGTGLRYKVVIDRAMDIVDTFYNEHSLAWLSHGGIIAPQRSADKGLDWLQTFGGGLMTTCGLTHISGPEKDEHGDRGLHGPISNTPAEIISILQPDPVAGNMEMSITGIMHQSRVAGPKLVLKRTISGTLGQASIRIRDEVINQGNTDTPHMLLYHFNLGWPLVDEGATICWKGSWKAREGDITRIFQKDHDFHKCLAPLDSHAGAGEEAAFIDPVADTNGWCACGVHNADIGIALSIRFKKAQLPWLTNWQHWGKGEYVMGLEPGTNPPIGQSVARKQGTLLFLAPGESRQYDLEIDVLRNKEKIAQFLTDLS